MNLIVDIGNTAIKFALFQEQTLLVNGKGNSSDFETFVEEKQIDLALISSVANSKEVESILRNLNIPYSLLNSETSLPIGNHYQTKETLGYDRLSNAVGGNSLFVNQNVLVIDCGTCIKFDFVSSENNYLGGAISPGLYMRFKALHEQTAQLPLLEPEKIETFIGDTSKKSILSGVMNGCIQEIDGVIAQYQAIYDKLTVILTGGDAISFENELKSNIFVEQNLTLIGLNEILIYNTPS